MESAIFIGFDLACSLQRFEIEQGIHLPQIAVADEAAAEVRTSVIL